MPSSTVHFTGNYIDQSPEGPPYPGYGSDSESEDAYNLNDVSSDVEMELDPAELDDEDSAYV